MKRAQRGVGEPSRRVNVRQPLDLVQCNTPKRFPEKWSEVVAEQCRELYLTERHNPCFQVTTLTAATWQIGKASVLYPSPIAPPPLFTPLGRHMMSAEGLLQVLGCSHRLLPDEQVRRAAELSLYQF